MEIRFKLIAGLFACAALIVNLDTSAEAQSANSKSAAVSNQSSGTVLSARSARKANRNKRKNKNKNKDKVRELSSICKRISPLRGALLKNAYPGHISRADPRASGFAFICGKECPSKFPVTAYFSDGTQAFKVGYYGRWDETGRPRAYCAAGGVPRCSASGVAREAKRKGRDGKVYLDFGSKSCRAAIPGQRNGSPL